MARLKLIVGGGSSLTASGVFFLFVFFDNGVVFSEVDDHESPDEADVLLSNCFFCVFSLVFDSVWNFIPLVGFHSVGFPPVRFPVVFFYWTVL